MPLIFNIQGGHGSCGESGLSSFAPRSTVNYIATRVSSDEEVIVTSVDMRAKAT